MRITDATLTDDLTAVLDGARVTAGPTAGATITRLDPELDEPDHRGRPDDPHRLRTVTLDAYADLGDKALANRRRPRSRVPGAAAPAPGCATSHSAPTVNVTKTSSRPTPLPGRDTVTYTITLTNTGTANVPTMTVNDDLTQVLDDATFQGDPAANAGTAGRTGQRVSPGPARSPRARRR